MTIDEFQVQELRTALKYLTGELRRVEALIEVRQRGPVQVIFRHREDVDQRLYNLEARTDKLEVIVKELESINAGTAGDLKV
jgi:hypothetical protein